METDGVRKEALIEWKLDGVDSELSIMIGMSQIKMRANDDLIRESLKRMGILYDDIEQVTVDFYKFPICPDNPPPELGPGED